MNIEIFALGQAPIRLTGIQATLQGTDGEFTVLPGHAALMGTLAIGVMEAVLEDGSERSIAVNGGFVEVSNDRLVVLTKTAEMGADIDLARAEAAKSRAEERLQAAHSNIDLARAEVALKRALMRIRASGGTLSRKTKSH